MSFKAPVIVCLTFALAALARPAERQAWRGRTAGAAAGRIRPARRPAFAVHQPAGRTVRAAPGQGDARAAWLRLVDPTGSGVIAAEALAADARRYFAVLDRDHNGAIEGAEVSVYENTIVPEILSGGGGPPGAPGGLQGAARFGLLNDPQPIRSADFNLDHRVALAEYERKARETFARLDANHDGVLRVSELPPPPSLNAPRRGGGRPGGPPGGGRGGPGGGRR